MYLQQIIFYIFSLVAVASATTVVVSNNPVRSALFLVLTFFSCAGLWILAHAEFLALILILVYVGAVMTLFLFVIMMLNIDVVSMRRRFLRYLPIGVGILGLLIFLMIIAIRPENFTSAHLSKAMLQPADYSNVKELGYALYTNYALGFELAGVLLLIAIISAISLANRGPRDCKTQRPSAQIRVRKSDRIRLIKMKTEKYE